MAIDIASVQRLAMRRFTGCPSITSLGVHCTNGGSIHCSTRLKDLAGKEREKRSNFDVPKQEMNYLKVDGGVVYAIVKICLKKKKDPRHLLFIHYPSRMGFIVSAEVVEVAHLVKS